MESITKQELSLIKQSLDALNEAFPVADPGIPTQKWEGNKLINTFVKEDPHFLAYKFNGIWWLCCRNYGVWQEAYDYMHQFCQAIEQETGVTMHPCHEHPISMARYKRLHVAKRAFMIGKVSWA